MKERAETEAAATAASVEPQPAPQEAPSPGKSFACRGCGAKLEFGIGAQQLTCPYCGAVEEIPETAEGIQELAYLDYLDEGRTTKVVIEGAELELRCKGCGAAIQASAETQTDDCPFCGIPFEAPAEASKATLEPAALLPFKVDDRDAKKRFRQWVASRWFAPNSFQHIADLGRLVGVYTPYWTYDAMTLSFYTGQRGEHYYVTETYTANENGRSVTRTRQVRRTRWYPASGRVQHWFDDVTVLASKGMPRDLAESLEPWDLDQLVDFRSDYLRGFRTERYQLDLQTGFERAKERMVPTIQQLVRRDIGGDEQRIVSLQTQHSGITFKHILLPVWLAAYRHAETLHRVLINARTGEVQGTRPWSVWKIAAAVAAGAVAAATLFHLFGGP